MKPARAGRPVQGAVVLLGGLLAFAASWAGCSQNAVTVPIRSLEGSGKAAFLCVRNHGPEPGLPLEQCHVVSPALAVDDFTVPHMISLVTQTTRGEVAVVDVTAAGVVDLDKSVPGFNFLPVGALPTDVVATPGSSAAFVTVADPNRSGIFAISSSHLFLEQNDSRGPTLASLPACGLPAAPTQMVLVRDLSPGASTRARCDAASPVTVPLPDSGYSLAAETALYGPLKLVVTLPELKQMVVIDAQELLARTPGTFDACPIEGTLDLTADIPLSSKIDATMAASSSGATSSDGGVTVSPDEAGVSEGGVQDTSVAEGGADGGATGGACAGGSTQPSAGRTQPSAPFGTAVHLGAMAYSDDGRIFVSDDGVSAIHVIDAIDPCHLALQPPLLPISRADLSRAVLTGPLAVSPLTTDLKRFVYAVDLKDNGSVMVFDVSQGSTDRTPLFRPDVMRNQFEPPDRMAFGSAVQSLTFGTQEVPLVTSGQVPRGQKCDPKNLADPYRTDTGAFASGAGPRILRGTYGFLVLATSQVLVVDLDDYDAACRRPNNTDAPSLGCGSPDGTHLSDAQAVAAFPVASQEVSCKVVERHRARSAQYISNVAEAGNHAPAMQSFPLLRDKDGTVLSVDPFTDGAASRPKLLGPCLDVDSMGAANLQGPACSCGSQEAPVEDMFLASISGGTTTAADFCPIPYGAGASKPAQGAPVASRNWVAFDLREPRAHLDQTWSITFEGILSPWLASRRGRLECATPQPGGTTVGCESGTAPSHFTLFDSDAGFCDHGAQGADLAASEGLTSGDIVEIIDPLPDPADTYWQGVTKVCNPDSCLAQYGTPDQPVVVSTERQITARGLDPNQTWLRRDLLVTKSFEDRLDLQPSFAESGAGAAPLTCCFPYPVTYAVRGGSQWIVNGSQSGFEHRLIPDPTATDSSTAACIVSCDQNLQLRNGRAARRAPSSPILGFDDKGLFRNEALQFVVWDPQSCSGQAQCLQRDMAFTFQQVGGFAPLAVSLSSNALVMPQAISFVPGLSQLAIPDATSQGLILFDLQRIAATQSLF